MLASVSLLVCGIIRKEIAYVTVLPGEESAHSRPGWSFVPRLHVWERISQGLPLGKNAGKGNDVTHSVGFELGELKTMLLIISCSAHPRPAGRWQGCQAKLAAPQAWPWKAST